MLRDGDVAACVASVSALEEGLTPDRIKLFEKDIAACSLLVVDTNLSPSALTCAVHIARDAGVPVVLETVSIVKCMRCIFHWARVLKTGRISSVHLNILNEYTI